jgi:hypothetical protein
VTLQDLGSLGEFVAAIATLATLIYLALQIRQNTRESQAASRNLVSQSFVDFCFHVSGDLEITKLTRRGLIDPESLDDDETLRFAVTWRNWGRRRSTHTRMASSLPPSDAQLRRWR